MLNGVKLGLDTKFRHEDMWSWAVSVQPFLKNLVRHKIRGLDLSQHMTRALDTKHDASMPHGT